LIIFKLQESSHRPKVYESSQIIRPLKLIYKYQSHRIKLQESSQRILLQGSSQSHTTKPIATKLSHANQAKDSTYTTQARHICNVSPKMKINCNTARVIIKITEQWKKWIANKWWKCTETFKIHSAHGQRVTDVSKQKPFNCGV